ncbi:hypothetical protein ABEY43_07130 [Priestia megaterium]
MDKDQFKQLFKELLESDDVSIYIENSDDRYSDPTIEIWIDQEKVYYK